MTNFNIKILDNAEEGIQKIMTGYLIEKFCVTEGQTTEKWRLNRRQFGDGGSEVRQPNMI